MDYKDISKLMFKNQPWRITYPFGDPSGSLGRNNPHFGTDIGLDSGTVIYAPESFEVMYEQFGILKNYNKLNKPNNNKDWGNFTAIYIPSWDVTIQLSHLMYGELAVDKGKKYPKGTIIAKSGNTGYSTGPHLDLMVAKGRVKSLEDMLNKAVDFEQLIIEPVSSKPTTATSKNKHGQKVKVGQRVRFSRMYTQDVGGKGLNPSQMYFTEKHKSNLVGWGYVKSITDNGYEVASLPGGATIGFVRYVNVY